MSRSAGRLLAAVMVVAVGSLAMTGAVVAGADPAGADPVGQCTTTSGVIVAVDFSPWGGAVERGCALAPADGLAGMGAAGFPVAQVSTEPGFVCRITDPATGTAQPAAVAGDCNVTPPASAYWSYWHAEAGADTWTYSPLGAASATPGPGSVDAWVFGAGSASNGQPSFTPDAVRATNPIPVGGATATTATTASPSTAGTVPINGGGSSSTGSTPATVVPTGGDTPTTAPPTAVGGAVPTTTLDGGVAPSATTHHGSPRVVDVTPAQAATVRATAEAGSPLPLVVGAVVVVLLAGGTWLAVRRRRRTV